MQLQLNLINKLPTMLGLSVKNAENAEQLAKIFLFPRQFETPSAKDTADALVKQLTEEITDLSGKLGKACRVDMEAVRDNIVRPALASSIRGFSMDQIEEALEALDTTPVMVHQELPEERLTIADYVRTVNDRQEPEPEEGRSL